MEKTDFRSNHMSKVFWGFGFLYLLLLADKACAREFIVGGSNGWRVPSDPQTYDQWAERNRFQIGDSLLFVYPSDQDSVLRVTSDAYASCNTDAPIAKFTDSHTSFTFNQSGPYYFISGNKDNCQKNEKLRVVVMAHRSNIPSTPPSPQPSSPSPEPSGEEAPSPPANIPVELNPAPAPSQGSKPSFAPSVSAGPIGFFAATMASSLFLPF